MAGGRDEAVPGKPAVAERQSSRETHQLDDPSLPVLPGPTHRPTLLTQRAICICKESARGGCDHVTIGRQGIFTVVHISGRNSSCFHG